MSLILKGYCNGKTKKSMCAGFNRNLFRDINIPVSTNGAILTGKTWESVQLYSGKCLTVIDLDCERPIPIEIILDLFDRNTFTVRTGSGGLHLYYYVDQEVRNSASKTKKGTRPTAFAKKNNIKDVDIRGEGGIVFAPGSKFIEHDNPYIIELDTTIQEITLEEFISIFDKLIETIPPEEVLEVIDETPEKYIIKKYNVNTINTKQTIPQIRRGFNAILNGDIKITNEFQKDTGVPEFLYWAGLWRECLSVGVPAQTVSKYLEDNQPEYEAETTEEQLVCLHNKNKRPTRSFYYKLFPWEKEDLFTDMLDEFDSLKDEFNRVKTQMKLIIEQFNGVMRKVNWIYSKKKKQVII